MILPTQRSLLNTEGFSPRILEKKDFPRFMISAFNVLFILNSPVSRRSVVQVHLFARAGFLDLLIFADFMALLNDTHWEIQHVQEQSAHFSRADSGVFARIFTKIPECDFVQIANNLIMSCGTLPGTDWERTTLSPRPFFRRQRKNVPSLPETLEIRKREKEVGGTVLSGNMLCFYSGNRTRIFSLRNEVGGDSIFVIDTVRQ
jgi:hypothetical protein